MEGVVTRVPKFELFEEKILGLKEIKAKIQTIRNSTTIGWLNVNANP